MFATRARTQGRETNLLCKLGFGSAAGDAWAVRVSVRSTEMSNTRRRNTKCVVRQYRKQRSVVFNLSCEELLVKEPAASTDQIRQICAGRKKTTVVKTCCGIAALKMEFRIGPVLLQLLSSFLRRILDGGVLWFCWRIGNRSALWVLCGFLDLGYCAGYQRAEHGAVMFSSATFQDARLSSDRCSALA